MNDPGFVKAASHVEHYCRLLDEAITEADDAAHTHSKAEAAYRTAHGTAFFTAKADGATDAQAKAIADADSGDVKAAQVLAADQAQIAIEVVRSRRTQVSAWQTLLNAQKAEVEMATYTPEMPPKPPPPDGRRVA